MHANIPALGPNAMMTVAICNDASACLARFIEQSLALAPPMAKPEPEVEERLAA